MFTGIFQLFDLTDLQVYLRKLAEGGIVAAVFGALYARMLKQRRLRSAIKMEVEKTASVYRGNFTEANRVQIVLKTKNDPNYAPVILTSDRHVVIGNLTDDIAFMNIRMARRVLRFNDQAEMIDDWIRYVRSQEYLGLNLTRKLAIVDIPFNQQNEIQGLAMQLMAEL